MGLAAGIDTWSVGWYLRPDSSAEKAIKALATDRVKRFTALPDQVEDHKVLYDPNHRFLVAEGHPSQDGLAPVDPELLLAVQEAVADGLDSLGIGVPREVSPFDRPGSPGSAGVRRLDLAVDVEGDGQEGTALLAGVAAVEPPGRLRSVVHRSATGNRVETISWQGGRGKVSRVYDKGVEQLTHSPGERVRFEDQRRYPAGARPLVEDLSAGYARAMFRMRFGALQKATKGVVVTSQAHAIQVVQELVDEGTLSATEAVKVIGYLVIEQSGVDVNLSRSTEWRFRKMAREAGVVMTSCDLEQELRIDLGDRVEDVLSSAEWAALN